MTDPPTARHGRHPVLPSPPHAAARPWCPAAPATAFVKSGGAGGATFRLRGASRPPPRSAPRGAAAARAQPPAPLYNPKNAAGDYLQQLSARGPFTPAGAARRRAAARPPRCPADAATAHAAR